MAADDVPPPAPVVDPASPADAQARRSRHWAPTFLRSHRADFRRGVSGRAHEEGHRRGGHRADSLSPRKKVTADDTVPLWTARPRYAMAAGADDTGRDLQWGLTRLQAEDLWQRSTGAGITVAVVDSGVKASNPDLKGKVAKGYNAITGKPGARSDKFGHGTFIAGMIAGKTNGSGIAGLAPNARIPPVKVLDRGDGDSDDIARGIIWAVDNGADVINMSFGSDSANRVEAEAIDYARGAGVTWSPPAATKVPAWSCIRPATPV